MACECNKNILIKAHKLHENAVLPGLGTPLSACHDLSVCLGALKNGELKMNGGEIVQKVSADLDGKLFCMIPPGGRALLPTGLIFLLPTDWQMKILPRSGNAWKTGYTVLNSPGTIDPDYTNQTMVVVFNTTNRPIIIKDGDKVAQAECTPMTSLRVHFSETDIETVETYRNSLERQGGFGHTGR